MTTRCGSTNPVRPILSGSVSADAGDCTTSSSTESGKETRRHSVTNASLRDKATPVKADGSLRKVSRWFRDFTQKMDPIKVKDRIRYSRASLVPQADVNQREENVFRRHGKTATIGPRRSSRKALEKRFNSMESLPATEKHRPQNIRKMKSFQFDEINDNDRECNPSRSDLFTEQTQKERLDVMTEAISLKLNDREKLFREILHQSTQNQFTPSMASDVKASLLASASLTTELTHLINVSIRPENLRPQQQPLQLQQQQSSTTTINITTPEVEMFIDSASNLIDILGRLQYQLSTLRVAMDESSEKVNRLKMVSSTQPSTEALSGQSLLPLRDPSSLTSRRESTCRHSSLSDSECFLSLINDLGDSLDDYDVENDSGSIPAT